jgi:hypothetical protein
LKTETERRCEGREERGERREERGERKQFTDSNLK